MVEHTPPDPELVARHLDAVRAALPLVALAERADADALAIAVGHTVADPTDAGMVIHGLVSLVRDVLGRPAVHGPQRLQALDGMTLQLAREA